MDSSSSDHAANNNWADVSMSPGGEIWQSWADDAIYLFGDEVVIDQSQAMTQRSCDDDSAADDPFSHRTGVQSHVGPVPVSTLSPGDVRREPHDSVSPHSLAQAHADARKNVAFGATPPLLPRTAPLPESDTKIGTVHIDKEGKSVYKCQWTECVGKIFGRPHELKRHYQTVHVVGDIWCPYSDCNRSEGAGGMPFPAAREDKLRDHVRRVHKNKLEV